MKTFRYTGSTLRRASSEPRDANTSQTRLTLKASASLNQRCRQNITHFSRSFVRSGSIQLFSTLRLPINSALRNLIYAMVISSPSNDRLKHARRVRDGREPGLIFIEGERLTEECLQSCLKLTGCFHTPDPNPRAQKIIVEMERRGCPLYPTHITALETVSDTVTTQGLIAIAERPLSDFDQTLTARDGVATLVVCLDAAAGSRQFRNDRQNSGSGRGERRPGDERLG